MNDHTVSLIPTFLKQGTQVITFPVREMLLPQQRVAERQPGRNSVLPQQRQNLRGVVISEPDGALSIFTYEEINYNTIILFFTFCMYAEIFWRIL